MLHRVVIVTLAPPGPPCTWADINPQHPKDLLQHALPLPNLLLPSCLQAFQLFSYATVVCLR
jgi:hypothetical protein